MVPPSNGIMWQPQWIGDTSVRPGVAITSSSVLMHAYCGEVGQQEDLGAQDICMGLEDRRIGEVIAI